MIVKNWRIYIIFEAAGLRRRAIQDSKLIKASMAMVGIEILILVIWMIIDLPRPTILAASDMDRIVICSSKSATIQTAMTSTLLLLNFLFMVVGAWFGFQTRNVKSEYNEAKYIGYTIQSTLVVAVITSIFVYFSITSATIYLFFYVKMSGILLAAFCALALLIGTKIYAIYFEADPGEVNNGTSSGGATGTAITNRGFMGKVTELHLSGSCFGTDRNGDH